MAENLGSPGELNANLTIPQAATAAFVFEHYYRDDEGEHAVDHEGFTARARLQRDTEDGREDFLLDDYASMDGADVALVIPAEATARIGTGTWNWDLFIEDASGVATRLVYGKVKVVDTYARDA